MAAVAPGADTVRNAFPGPDVALARSLRLDARALH